MRALASYMYILVLSLWVGGMSLFTFLITPVIFKSYARDAAGEIVGRLFPSYFLFGLGVAAAGLLIFIFSAVHRPGPGSRASLALLILALCISLYVRFHLHPKTERVKETVSSFETSGVDDPARKAFRALHAQSAVLNLLMIVDGTVLLVIAVGARP